MTVRKNTRAVDVKSTFTAINCSGSIAEGNGSMLGGLSFLGYSKSGIIKSDMLRPTDYWCRYQNTANTGSCKWREHHVTCAPYTASGYSEWKNWTSPFGVSNLPFRAFRTEQSFPNSTDAPAYSTFGTSLRGLCTNEMLKKLKSEKMQLLVSLGESKQTLSLVGDLGKVVSGTILHIARGILNPLSIIPKFQEAVKRHGFRRKLKTRDKRLNRFHNALYDAYRRKRPGIPSDIQRVGESATSMWLCYRYGILPLMSDLDAANQILMNDILKFEFDGVLSARYRQKFEGTATTTGDYSGHVLVNSKCKGTAEVKSIYKIADHSKNDIKRLSMSLRDVPATVYELIPFSFVFDWFLDLGSYFNAFGASYGLTHIASYFSLNERCESKAKLSGNYTLARGGSISSYQDAENTYGMFRRETMPSFPTPYLPSFTLPFRGSLDPRIFDAISLITQLSGKTKTLPK